MLPWPSIEILKGYIIGVSSAVFWTVVKTTGLSPVKVEVVDSALTGGRTDNKVAKVNDVKSRYVKRFSCFVTYLPFPHENV